MAENLKDISDKNLQLEKASAEIDRETENLRESIDTMEKCELTSVTYIPMLPLS